MITDKDYAIFFHGDKLLANGGGISFIMPFSEVYKNHNATLDEQNYFFLGKFEGKNIFAVTLNLMNTKADFSFVPARDALKIADIKTSQFICRGKQLLHWNNSSLYCRHCGSSTKLSQTETAKICQICDKVIYPTTSPVVVVLIERNGHLLLARSPHFAKGLYSALAGFVEVGESCEAAVHREVKEEVGIKVTNISYFGSQAWPFPSSLILAFRA